MPARLLLLVDADADCEQVVSRAASLTNYEMLLAQTSAAAFEILGNGIHLDLVVVDIDPGAHGLALLEAITACADRPPMVVVTALEEVYMEAIAAEHGAAACLGKPLLLPRLLTVLRDISMHRGLTCDRWGSLIPLPVREPVNSQGRFRGIAAKLSAGRKVCATKSRE